MSAFFGYIDPSSGSMAIQFLIAALAGAGIIMRNYLFWPVSWMFRCFRRGGESES